jgi:gamma-glutamyltranspeptidase / glutathione hydrolase
MTVERIERWHLRKPAAIGTSGIVTSQHYAAAEAGATILAKGGNAVDAAVTAGFVLQTVEPWMSGLSACGYMMVAEPDGNVHAVEFTGRAPQRFDPATYEIDPDGTKTFLGMPASRNLANVRGFSATVVPGAVRGLAAALERFGTIGFDTALAPALDRARHGMKVDWHTTLALAMAEADLTRDPAARAIYFPSGTTPEPGEVLPLTKLAETLERLAAAGPEDFYMGRIAERLIDDLSAGGSFITAEDLAGYRPSITEGASGPFAGRRVHVAEETSGGRRLLETLAAFDRAPHEAAGPGFYTAMAGALQDAFAAHRQRNTAGELAHAASTTHVNAVDAQGRMVALTFTLLNRFGARVVSPSTGALLNNGMAWFDPRPGLLYSLTPGAVARNNMCPVAIMDDNGPFAVLGASGGNQIVPALAQVAAFLVDETVSVEDALHAPRLNTGPTSDVLVDLDMPADVVEALSALGPIRFAERAVFPRPFASPAAIARRGNHFEGMPDTTYPAAQAVSAPMNPRTHQP